LVWKQQIPYTPYNFVQVYHDTDLFTVLMISRSHTVEAARVSRHDQTNHLSVSTFFRRYIFYSSAEVVQEAEELSPYCFYRKFPFKILKWNVGITQYIGIIKMLRFISCILCDIGYVF
jgi:hypothetical protein